MCLAKKMKGDLAKTNSVSYGVIKKTDTLSVTGTQTGEVR